MQEIVIYQTPDHKTAVEVRFEGDTFWLTQSQIAELFQKERSVITKHINNVFKEGELEELSNVQKMHIPNSDKPVAFYSLDLILSVGYRVNSKRGTQFRQWATQRLKDFLVEGYAFNQKRLDELQKTIQIISQNQAIGNLQEAQGLLEIISHYAQSFVLLNQFDSQTIQNQGLNENISYEISYEDAQNAIRELKSQLIAQKEATALFGNEKDDSFQGILGSVVQTFDGHYLYPSVEEQAAHLLYFIIKNHPFSDGNKRIGAFMFVWFLEKNRHRFKANGELKINDNTLVSLALLVAQSNPSDKEIMIRLIVKLISK